MEEKGKNYRIGNVTAVILLFLAAVADAITLIPIAGDFLGWLFWGIMAIYFWHAGLGWFNWRRAVPGIISAVAEFFPVVQELPTILSAMVIILILTRFEDKTGVSLIKPLQKGKRLPLYKDGVGRVRVKEDEVLPDNHS